MKTAMILSFFLSLPSAVFARNDGPARAVKTFAQAGDAQDLAVLEAVLHEDFRVDFVVKGTRKASVMSKSEYLGLAKAKKIGGDVRKVKVLKVDIQDHIAFVRLRLTGKKASFESMQTVIETEQGWKILTESVLFAPKS